MARTKVPNQDALRTKLRVTIEARGGVAAILKKVPSESRSYFESYLYNAVSKNSTRSVSMAWAARLAPYLGVGVEHLLDPTPWPGGRVPPPVQPKPPGDDGNGVTLPRSAEELRKLGIPADTMARNILRAGEDLVGLTAKLGDALNGEQLEEAIAARLVLVYGALDPTAFGLPHRQTLHPEDPMERTVPTAATAKKRKRLLIPAKELGQLLAENEGNVILVSRQGGAIVLLTPVQTLNILWSRSAATAESK